MPPRSDMNDTGAPQTAEPHALDVARLAAWLTPRLEGFAGPAVLEKFAGGQSNPTYRLVTPSRTYVLRTRPGPAAKLLPSAHAVEREFRIMQALGGSEVPVPRMHLLCEDESVIGRAFYVMEFVSGRVLWDPALPGMTAVERRAIYDEMNRVIASLHNIPVAQAGLADYGQAGNYFQRQIGRWSKQYFASQTVPIPSMDRLMEWLPAHIPDSARDESATTIVHGDYRVDNLIFHPSEPRVLAVLDWELSTIGHPLADFSYNCLSWHIDPGVFRGLGGLDLDALGIPAQHDYVRQYCERTRRYDVDALMRDWNFYLAYNLFRLAAIAQGIAKRVEVGTAASSEARAMGAAAPALSDLAWSFACRA